ncbi:iron-containing alcohol dehydrogenase [Francisellaceae bacterium]|nr:iron-containing alcohol dehydrogenase [Francisellaceae bacterium]
MWNKVYQFNFPTVMRFGAGVINETSMHLNKQGIKKPLIVTDPVLAKLPIVSDIVSHLKENGLNVEVFADIAKNPVESDVTRGVEKYHQSNCDAIIGVGGGASMDVARAIVLMANHPGSVFDYEDGTGGDEQVKDENIPYFIAVPTTSGTGSEVGRSAIISDETTHQKKVIFAPQLLAKLVLADPALTLALPPFITAATGVDALVHNVEAYLVNTFHPMCDGIALEGMRLIHESLEGAVKSPNIENRSKMMAASTMGAVAFQKGLGVVHSCAHALSAFNNLHHGLANAIMFTECMRFNESVCREKFEAIEKQLEISDFVHYTQHLNMKVGIELGLSNHGITEKDIDKIAELALADGCHLSNPRKVTLDDFKYILYRSL